MLEYLRNVVENYPRRETDREYSVPFVTVMLFSVPPLLILAGARGWVSLVVVRFWAVAVVFVTAAHVFWIKGYHAENFDPNQFDLDEAKATLRTEVWPDPAAVDPDEDVWLAEYRQVSRTVRSHDALAIRASYFSLATLGILASVFFTISNALFRPFVALFAMSIAFAFHIVVEKNVIVRDALRERQIALEREAGTLTAGRTRDLVTGYGQYPSANLGSQLVDFNKFWLYAWIFGYHASTIYVAFLVVG